ncbi:outer membrane protein assembly factor BamD [Parvibium lacunae]|uniref:Outer membrane protein assembly factor BamD n=1 Tax=Parvibium lacunae TaxID=1888893 RepID=A0A368L8L2_9BURK|nr:outer membrane protein assembly factor BamD [Parvibium lacunae]RCS59947.1 outer membrane protein assembly factor BamD [Parvibium lacunae]
MRLALFFLSLPRLACKLTSSFIRALTRWPAGVACLLLATASLTGCGILDQGEADETKGWSAQKLYSAAREEIDGGNFEKAVKLLEKMEGRYPFGRYAQQAQLEIAYAYFKQNDAVQALAAVDRFIRLYPSHPFIDYAYYLRGLINFYDDVGLISRIFGQDRIDRDPKATRDAFDAFKELVTRFPESKYAPDALERMQYLVNALAQYEVNVAAYYMKRRAYVAALARAQTTIKQYPEAPAQEQALVIIVQAYDALKMKELRDDNFRVLQRNFPASAAKLKLN